MDIEILCKSLSLKEKNDMFKLLSYELYNIEKPTFTPLVDFIEEEQMSSRLYNVLKWNRRSIGKYLELVDLDSLRNCRYSGKKTVQEFISIRGY